LARKQTVLIFLAGAGGYLSRKGHGRAVVGSVVGATCLKGAVLVKAGIDNENTARSYTVLTYQHYAAGICERTVQGQVQVYLKTETYLLQVRISVVAIAVASA